jgi:hypothetical protein
MAKPARLVHSTSSTDADALNVAARSPVQTVAAHNAKAAKTARPSLPPKTAKRGRYGLKRTCRNGRKTLASTGKISMLQPETA